MTDHLIVPYAVDSWTNADIDHGSASAGLGATPFIGIDPAAQEPLRLNNAPYPQIAISAETPNPLDHLRSIFHQMCKPWDKLAHAFIDAYLNYLLCEIQRDRVNLEARARLFAGLFNAQDWIFSAPRPLPRANLPISTGNGVNKSDSYIQVEFAFWIGTHFVAALSKEHGLSPTRARTRLAQLTDAGIRCVTYGSADLREPEKLFVQILGSTPTQFWNAQSIPSGPFPARIEVVPCTG